LGFSLDYLTSIELVSANPALIKIDVDGIEDLILKGGERTLKNLSLKSVLVEVTPKFDNQLLGVRSILTEAGFKLRNDMDDSNPHGYNQIWVR
jgi:hypothetical protein